MDIRKWVLDYGLCQDFDVDDAVSMVRAALVELGTTPNKQSAPCYRCSDYYTCDKKIAHILPQCFVAR